MSTSQPTIDEHCCPICGRANHCGAHGSTPCWCRDVKIPAQVLARVPAALQGKACICQDCLRAYQDLAAPAI